MMATRLMKHDLHEMMLEWPVQNLAGESRTERNSYRIDNGYLKATFEEICTPFFSIMEDDPGENPDPSGGIGIDPSFEDDVIITID